MQPKRVDVVSLLPSAMTLEEFARRYPSTVNFQTVAIINQARSSAWTGGDLPSERGR